MESLQLGLGLSAALAVCGAAMSDMKGGAAGEAGVKGAWAACAALAAKDYWQGWRHTRRRDEAERAPALSGCGWSALAMCGLYMVRGPGRRAALRCAPLQPVRPAAAALRRAGGAPSALAAGRCTAPASGGSSLTAAPRRR